jgi:hypothetical protein
MKQGDAKIIREVTLTTNGQMISIGVATRRAAKAILRVALKYQVNSGIALHALKGAASGKYPVPIADTIFVSDCYDVADVVREIELINLDGTNACSPVPSYEMYQYFTLKKCPVKIVCAAAAWGYFLGQSDEAHKQQDDIAFLPYASHTPQEMISMFVSIYRQVEGDELDFMRYCIGSSDTRLNKMNAFAREVMFQFAKSVVSLYETGKIV